MNSAIVYAFGVGMVATFNPCGFATVLRALAVGAAMTAGFVVVFGVLGLVLDPILSSIIDKLPWLTIVLGIVLVILGIRLLMGREITVGLPKISKSPEGRELGSVFVFGISYALVSLSCTLSLFIAAISTVIDQQNFFIGLGAFIAYALGMGLVLIVLTLAIALARQGIVMKMRGVLPHINRISGVLLVIAGLYVAYYGWYELRVLNGNTSGGGIAGWMFNLNGHITQWINEVGPTRIGLILGLVIAIIVFIALLSKARTDDK
jgi:cytochrome c biogenesis protein CcdA